MKQNFPSNTREGSHTSKVQSDLLAQAVLGCSSGLSCTSPIGRRWVSCDSEKKPQKNKTKNTDRSVVIPQSRKTNQCGNYKGAHKLLEIA